MVFSVQCSHTERMNSTVQSNPRELDQTKADFSLVSVRASHFQSSPVHSRNLQTAPQTSDGAIDSARHTIMTSRNLPAIRLIHEYYVKTVV